MMYFYEVREKGNIGLEKNKKDSLRIKINNTYIYKSRSTDNNNVPSTKKPIQARKEEKERDGTSLESGIKQNKEKLKQNY